MSIAAATPIIPWSDLVYSLMPNGRTLDYTITNPYVDAANAGDDARSSASRSRASSAGSSPRPRSGSYYPGRPRATRIDADLTSWFARVNAGEPYTDPVVQRDPRRDRAVPVALQHARGNPAGPAPLFISNGWTDDLFPPDEALRFYNRERAEFPGNPIALLFANHGHQRGANACRRLAIIRSRVQAEFDHFVKGDGPARPRRAASRPTSPRVRQPDGDIARADRRRRAGCPASRRGPPDRAGRRDRLAAGRSGREQGVRPDCRGQRPVRIGRRPTDAAGSATYRLPEVAGNGYTLLGLADGDREVRGHGRRCGPDRRPAVGRRTRRQRDPRRQGRVPPRRVGDRGLPAARQRLALRRRAHPAAAAAAVRRPRPREPPTARRRSPLPSSSCDCRRPKAPTARRSSPPRRRCSPTRPRSSAARSPPG